MIFFLLLSLTVASILDIKGRPIPLWISIPPLLAELSFLILARSWQFLLYRLGCMTILFLLLLACAIIGHLGGADVIYGASFGLYLGLSGFYAVLAALLFSLPYTAYMKYRRNEKPYPFLPYMLAGLLVTLSVNTFL